MPGSAGIGPEPGRRGSDWSKLLWINWPSWSPSEPTHSSGVDGNGKVPFRSSLFFAVVCVFFLLPSSWWFFLLIRDLRSRPRVFFGGENALKSILWTAYLSDTAEQCGGWTSADLVSHPIVVAIAPIQSTPVQLAFMCPFSRHRKHWSSFFLGHQFWPKFNQRCSYCFDDRNWRLHPDSP